jgi:hypothetical protein
MKDGYSQTDIHIFQIIYTLFFPEVLKYLDTSQINFPPIPNSYE